MRVADYFCNTMALFDPNPLRFPLPPGPPCPAWFFGFDRARCRAPSHALPRNWTPGPESRRGIGCCDRPPWPPAARGDSQRGRHLFRPLGSVANDPSPASGARRARRRPPGPPRRSGPGPRRFGSLGTTSTLVTAPAESVSAINLQVGCSPCVHRLLPQGDQFRHANDIT